MSKSKSIFITGNICFLILAFLSVLLYKERAYFVDIAFHTFAIITEGDFAIQNYRIGAFFTQLFPLLGSKMGLSLKTIVVCYSFSFILLYWLTFNIIYALKCPKIALAYLLQNLLFVAHTFYWAQSELPQALAFFYMALALFYNRLEQGGRAGLISTIVSVILLAFALVSHPLMLFVGLFVLAYLFISFPLQKKQIIYAAVIFISIQIFRFILLKTPYDNGAFNLLGSHLRSLLLQENLTIVPDAFKELAIQNILGIACLCLLAYHLITQRKFLLLCLVVSAVLGYTFIVFATYLHGAATFYIENQLLILAVFIGIPFTLDYLYNMQSGRSTFTAVISSIALLTTLRIYFTHIPYTQRLAKLETLLETTENDAHKKIIYARSAFKPDEFIMDWSISYETWLYSTIELGETRSIIIEETENEFDWALGVSDKFLVKWGLFSYSELNPRYFKFNDSGVYIKKNTAY